MSSLAACIEEGIVQPASRKASSTVRKQANLDPKVTVQMLYKQSLGASLPPLEAAARS
jgi:hypothetical protein